MVAAIKSMFLQVQVSEQKRNCRITTPSLLRSITNKRFKRKENEPLVFEAKISPNCEHKFRKPKLFDNFEVHSIAVKATPNNSYVDNFIKLVRKSGKGN